MTEQHVPQQQQQHISASSSSNWTSQMNDPWALPQPVQTPQTAPPVYPGGNSAFISFSYIFLLAQLGNDPWAPTSTASAGITTGGASVKPEPTPDPFAAWEQALEPTPALTPMTTNSQATNGNRKTPENFLGENSNLVNLDNLLGSSTPTNGGSHSLCILILCHYFRRQPVHVGIDCSSRQSFHCCPAKISDSQ